MIMGLMGLLMMGSTMGHAQSFRAQQNFHPSIQRKTTSDVISPNRAKKRAVAQYGGKALSAKLYQAGTPQAHYKVKLIQDGQFRIVRISATQ